MNVDVNDKVTSYVRGASDPTMTSHYNERIGAVQLNDDFTQWRHIGKSNDIYDARLSGDLRIVAERTATQFYVRAIYRHKNSGGKAKVAGTTVPNY